MNKLPNVNFCLPSLFMALVLSFVMLTTHLPPANGLFDHKTTSVTSRNNHYTSFDEDVCQLRLYGVPEFQGSLKIIRGDTKALKGRDKSLSVVGEHFDITFRTRFYRRAQKLNAAFRRVFLHDSHFCTIYYLILVFHHDIP